MLRAVVLRSWSPCRSVSTWTPLATAFNHRSRPKINFSLGNQQAGLFKRPELTSWEGFYAAKDSAIATSWDLVDEAVSGDRKRPLVQVFDELSDTLCRVADLAEFVRIAHPNGSYRRAAEDACIGISGVVEKLNTHRPLYDALRASVERGDSGDDHVARLFLFDFEQSAIHLPEDRRKRVVALNDAILQTGQRFMAGSADPRHVPKNTLPLHVQKYFGSGKEVAVSGLQAESSDPLAREAAYRVYLSPSDEQELQLVHLLHARHEMASQGGFRSYAQRAIKGSIMETPENVNEFLDVLSNSIADMAQKDFDDMRKMKSQEGASNDLGCWDVPYLSSLGRRAWLQASSADFTPYFSLGGCMEGFNLLMQSLYGISLQHEDMDPGESWASDVYKLAVVHQDEGLLGHIYCDLYERAHKPHQDCHFTIQGGRQLDDNTYQNPIVVVMMSLSWGSWGGPALLSPGSVDNLFHEMGHAMHSMLGRARWQHVAGTRCPTDLAEVPSVLMEYFSSHPEVLKTFAQHFQTQKPMPELLLQRLCAAKHLFSASEMQQQVFYSVLDQRYHSSKPLGAHPTTTEVLRDVQGQYYALPYVHNTAWHHRFSHLVGYGAKYYSYLISRACAWSLWCGQLEVTPLSRERGTALRQGLLRHGGGVPPRVLLDECLPEKQTQPGQLANKLAEELACHKDHIERVTRIMERR